MTNAEPELSKKLAHHIDNKLDDVLESIYLTFVDRLRYTSSEIQEVLDTGLYPHELADQWEEFVNDYER